MCSLLVRANPNPVVVFVCGMRESSPGRTPLSTCKVARSKGVVESGEAQARVTSAEPPSNPSRLLARVVLVGAAVLLVFLVAIPFVVPHQSLPEAIIVFVSVFILIAALIAGTAGAYLFLSRSMAAA
jgi:hypothetical protein